jgi:SNF2 family DNA or RNA helicase
LLRSLRIVIDEGHQLGRSSTTNAIQMASLLEAERRWILTGTPTRSSSAEVTTTALRHLYQMLRFIRYLPLSAPDSEALWKKFIAQPMERKTSSGMAPTQPGSYPLLQILSKVDLPSSIS